MKVKPVKGLLKGQGSLCFPVKCVQSVGAGSLAFCFDFTEVFTLERMLVLFVEEGRKCQKGQNEEKEYGTIVNCY